MRGVDHHDETAVRLAEDVVLHVDTADTPDQTALSRALTHPAHVQWTGIQVRDEQPIEHLDLWLLTRGGLPFGRLSVGAVAREGELVEPARRWAGACVYRDGTLAYLAARELDEEVSELGVIGHGPDSAGLAAELVERLRQWDRERPTQPSIIARRVDAGDPGSSPGREILRPNTALTVTW
jgi:protein-L-isoaspartate(D-aspartate) O-methyltransferase